MRALPPPSANSVPEPQPPASCMPTPNMKAPIATEAPTGAKLPVTGRPSTSPAASAGTKSAVAAASISNWARMPSARRPSSRSR